MQVNKRLSVCYQLIEMYCKNSQSKSDHQRTGIAHEYFIRPVRYIIFNESYQGAKKGYRHNSITIIVRKVEKEAESDRCNYADSSGETINAINKINSIDD